MSWDAVILKINGPIRPVEEVTEGDYLPLGSIESVAERIRASFPNAEWSSATWATWSLDGDTGITIDLEGVESSNSIVVSVSGSGNPVPHLLGLARANDWVVLDCSTTEFLSADEGPSEGWEGYQSLMGGLSEPIPGSGDRAPPQTELPTAPQVAPMIPPQTAPLTPPEAPPPRTRKKKQAAKKVKRKVMQKRAAKKSRPLKKSVKKKSPKKKQKKGLKKGLKKKIAKKTLKKKSPGKKKPKKKK